MDPFGNDEIARLLRLKRYEQPPPDYFENFLHEFRRRQRDELRRQPLWSICVRSRAGFRGPVQCPSPWHPTPQVSRQWSRAPQ